MANFKTDVTAGTNKDSNPVHQSNLKPRDAVVIPRVPAVLKLPGRVLEDCLYEKLPTC